MIFSDFFFACAKAPSCPGTLTYTCSITTLNAKGSTLCNHIAKKVSSWFVNPVDLALLVELVKDFGLPTRATTPATILKAMLIVLLSRGFDLNPEHLLVSRPDIMAMMKSS